MLTNLVREKRKTLSIVIDKEGEMHIRAPKNLPLIDILDFIKNKSKWIETKQTEIKNSLKQNDIFFKYEKFVYLGKIYNPVFINTNFEISINGNNIFIPDKMQAKKEQYVGKWLKNKALEIIENRVLYLSANYNLSFNNLYLINAKCKWGTCSSTKEIGFNWRLIMLNPKLIDYTIIHELAHLIELNHSEKFWNVVKTILPDFKERKEELKKFNFILQLFR